jgi:sensor domain DACNV-containing protein
MTDDLRLTPSYPAARLVAPTVRAHFAQHIEEARSRGHVVADVPPEDAIEVMIEAAFWASLRREEGYIPKISLAFVAPDDAPNPLRFARPLPLDPAALTRVAPAVERSGIHLAVDRAPGDVWMVWGTVRALPRYCFVLEAAAPGLLVVKHQRGELGKFVNVAVLEGDRIKIVDEDASSLPDCPPLLESLLGFESPRSWIDEVNVLVQLAVSMRAHGRGGLLLVVPPDGEGWRESIVQPISYGIEPRFTGLADLALATPEAAELTAWQQTLARSVDAIAGLTAVDGAAIITRRYDVVAFGAKITRRRGSPQVEQVAVTEPVEGGVPAIVHPSQLGGTRHLSAAQFVHDQRDALAMVASQDGRFTVFAWSPCEDMVHAHRVEVLLI